MIPIKNKIAFAKMEVAGQKVAELFEFLPNLLKSGVSTLEIDQWIDAAIIEKKMVSKTKGYGTYKHASCISVNDEVVHGIPKKEKILKPGDLVKIDICAAYDGYCADMARSFFVEQSDTKAMHLVKVAQQALDCGIAQIKVGNKISDISHAVQKEVEKYGYGVIRDFAGHGIGKRLHEDPEILNYGAPGRGPVIQVGMAFAIEPMITEKSYEVFVTDDGWTVKTVDGSLGAHVEDTVIVTDQGPKIITRLSKIGTGGV